MLHDTPKTLLYFHPKKGLSVALQDTITRENIEQLVTLFYHQAMRDPMIGEFFILELGEDLEAEEWREHIDLLVNFWSTLFLDEKLYFSDPYGPHFTIVGLEDAHFTRWVELFTDTSHQVYTPKIATQFAQKGLAYAKDFMQRLSQGKDTNNLKSKTSWE